jgi:hypothetical protein
MDRIYRSGQPRGGRPPTQKLYEGLTIPTSEKIHVHQIMDAALTLYGIFLLWGGLQKADNYCSAERLTVLSTSCSMEMVDVLGIPYFNLQQSF